MPETEALARHIRKIRTNKKMSQLDFALECGISLDILSIIERGKSNPRLSTIQKIASYVGCTAADLLIVEEEFTEKQEQGR